MKRLTREWIDKAEDDFNVATSLMRSRRARLCEDGTAFAKTHDLVALIALLLAKYPLWSSLTTAAVNLNTYAVSTRYPGDTASLVEARQAMKDCKAIRAEVRVSFGL